MYTDNFHDFVKNGVTHKYFIGTGNPNARILIIGKESAIDSSDSIGIEWYNNNAEDWKEHIENNTCEILEYSVNEKNHLFKSWGKNTWSKYQKLNDFIFKKEAKPYYVDFLKTVFTTEINDSPNKRTSNADRSEMNLRKVLLKESEFIQQFPVIILACSDYIRNNNYIREIDDIFDVTYDGYERGRFTFSKGNWFFTHHNTDKSKIVIHTRQLSANVKDDLLKNMGEIINEHLTNIDKNTER